MEPVYEIVGLAGPRVGYAICDVCKRGFKRGERSGLDTHICRKGFVNPPNRGFTVSSVQSFIGGRGSWFQIREVEVPLRDDVWARYEAEMIVRTGVLGAASLPDNYRVLHQFLHREGWMEHVENVEPEELIKLLEKDEEALPLLHRHIHAYLANQQGRLRDRYLWRLIGTRPM
jgi:hypothetical protein